MNEAVTIEHAPQAATPIAHPISRGNARYQTWLRGVFMARYNAQERRRMARVWNDPRYLRDATEAHLRAMHYLYWARQFRSGRYARSH